MILIVDLKVQQISYKSYMKSYFQDNSLFISVARAGNVISGENQDRIVPDSIVSWSQSRP